MFIKITKKDCQNIVNENLQGGGHNEITPLEKALAKKCLELYEKLGTINNECNTYFETLYSITVKINKATGDHLKNKRIHDLQAQSKAHFAQAVHLDQQLKGMIENEAKETI